LIVSEKKPRRRRYAPHKNRRPKALMRRKLGQWGDHILVHKEREIIART
jgi:hypothetical protein